MERVGMTMAQDKHVCAQGAEACNSPSMQERPPLGREETRYGNVGPEMGMRKVEWGM